MISRRSPAPMSRNAVEKAKHLSAPASAPSSTSVTIAVPHAGAPVGLDIIDPSPVAPSSNGTEFTDMEEAEEERREELAPAPIRPVTALRSSPPNPQSPLKIETSHRTRPTREEFSDEPLSVIHAPPGFRDFVIPNSTASTSSAVKNAASTTTGRSSAPNPSSGEDVDTKDPSPSQHSDVTVTSQAEAKGPGKRSVHSPVSPPPLTTTMTIPPNDWDDRATPQAQTRQEAEATQRHMHSASLEDIPEAHDTEHPTLGLDTESAISYQNVGQEDREHEVEALHTALSECWVLCNTLANLSSIHRNRLFGAYSKGETQEQAWRTCWSLCKKLYESRNDETANQTGPTLDLCREFCQALFEVRVRENEIADSVLRVSFELNNHLYNTHDRSLPEAFRERTLDFYITLCHRLMKQKTRLVPETDSLLRACWALAEMLFSLRQNTREGKSPDEELLGSAVQACWELCDLFREGWTQIRPERGTPRPSQTTFSQIFNQVRRAVGTNVPETPTTIFEDTITVLPDEAPEPNILVFSQTETSGSSKSRRAAQLQQDRRSTPSPVKTPNPQSQPYNRWSSNSSTLSGTSSRSSSHTASSTSTVRTNTSGGGAGPPGSNASSTIKNSSEDSHQEDPSLILLKLLFIRAAQVHGGFSLSGSTSLPSFAKSLSPTAFGPSQWQVSLLDNYKKVVIGDPAFKGIGGNMGTGATSSGLIVGRGNVTAGDVAKAVNAMVASGHFGWLRDLFRLVCGFGVDEVSSGKNGRMVIQT